MRLLAALGRHAAHQADKPAIIDNAGSVSYRELDLVTARVASMLARRGVRTGDIVALGIEPTAPGVALMLGAMKLGAVAAPLNTRLAGPEIAAYLGLIRPIVTLTDPAAGVAPEGAHVFGRLDERLPLLDRLELRDLSPIELPVIAEDAGAIALPTGGTTGLPKAALWSRDGLSEITVSNCIHLGVGRHDRELYISPLFHITIVAGLLPSCTPAAPFACSADSTPTPPQRCSTSSGPPGCGARRWRSAAYWTVSPMTASAPSARSP